MGGEVLDVHGDEHRRGGEAHDVPVLRGEVAIASAVVDEGFAGGVMLPAVDLDGEL